MIRRICAFCGSSPGARPAYLAAARSFGELLARRRIGLVYGGGSIGLMGAVADAALAAGGEVVGVIPRSLEARELDHRGLTEQHVVGSMHERKKMMSDLADAFVALPGGMGTLEELAEILTWSQLGLHPRPKPLGLLDVEGYWSPLVAFFDHAVAERFIRAEHRGMVLVDAAPEGMVRQLEAYQPPVVDKWIDREQT
jgi:uncharacterized protein (TIGR00730 family)